MTAQLESQYRRLLTWYPRSWRVEHEEAFLGTLLDLADGEGREVPTRHERASIASHGLSTRLDRLIVPQVRHAGSTIALTAGTGIAAIEFLFSSWAPWHQSQHTSGVWPARVGPFYDTGFLFAGLWLVALTCSLTGRWAIGRFALVASILASLVTPHLFTTYPGLFSVDEATLGLLAGCAVVALIGRPMVGPPTIGAASGWGLVVTVIYVHAPAGLDGWLPSSTLWSQVGTFWYAAAFALIVAVGLGIARLWNAAFTIVLGLTPLTLAFILNDIRQVVIESGSALLIAAPVGIGLLLLVLYSSGRLRLDGMTRKRRTTFGSTLVVFLLAGSLLATGTMGNQSEGRHLVAVPKNVRAFSTIQAFTVPPPVPAVKSSSISALVNSDFLASVGLDPRTGYVASFATRGGEATVERQSIMASSLSSAHGRHMLDQYVASHSTTTTVEAATGHITAITFGRG